LDRQKASHIETCWLLADFSARAARPTACQARGRGVGWLAVIELTTILRCAYGWSATVRREARRRAEVMPCLLRRWPG